MIDRYAIVAKYFYGMTRGVAKDKQRNFRKCSVSLVQNREIPAYYLQVLEELFAQKQILKNVVPCCSLCRTANLAKFYLSTDCDWDSSLVVFLLRLKDEMKNSEIKLDFTSLPPKLSNLLSFSCRNKTSDQQQNQNPELTLLKFILFPLSFFCRLRTI